MPDGQMAGGPQALGNQMAGGLQMQPGQAQGDLEQPDGYNGGGQNTGQPGYRPSQQPGVVEQQQPAAENRGLFSQAPDRMPDEDK